MYEEQERDDRYEEHQLVPLKGGRYSTVLKGPKGTDVGDLHCDLEPYVAYGKPLAITHSGWKPNEQQVAQLDAGAHVRLSVWQHPIPPLAVSIEPPTCVCHEKAMAWDPTDGNYYCSSLSEPPPWEREAAAETPLEQAHRDFEPLTDEDGTEI